MGILIAPFFTTRSNVACALVALCGVAIAFVFQLAVGTGQSVVGEHFVGLLVADQFAILWKLLLLLFVAGVILMWFTTTASQMHEGDGAEFFASVHLEGFLVGWREALAIGDRSQHLGFGFLFELRGHRRDVWRRLRHLHPLMKSWQHLL